MSGWGTPEYGVVPWPNRRIPRCQSCATGRCFGTPAGKRRKTAVVDGRAPPHISELIMALVPGGPSEKLSWLRQQIGRRQTRRR